jgi:GNAT superfamily N-acetyltransferase
MSFRIELLAKKHNKSGFHCGKKLLDNYIRFQASQDVKKKLAVCFVLVREDNQVIGYYTLSNNSINQKDIPENYQKKIPPSYRDIPVTLLGRLAVDSSYSGRGFGEHLLLHALENCLITAEKTIGSIAVIVDPIDQEAIAFYKKYGFILLPGSGKMFLPMLTIKHLFNSHSK